MEEMLKGLLEIVGQAGFEIVSIVLLFVVKQLSNKVTLVLDKKDILAQLENNKIIVKMAVDAVEQIATEVDSAGKFELAKDKVIAIMTEKGVKIAESEVDALIEATVNAMNKGIKDAKATRAVKK